MDFKDYIKKHNIDLTTPDIDFEVSMLFTQTRLDKAWTEAKLAKAMGTKQPAIARWEGGSMLPSIKTLKKLAKIAGKRLIIKFE